MQKLRLELKLNQNQQVSPTQVFVYNLFGTIVRANIPTHIESEFNKLKQQGEAGYREYDARCLEMVRKGYLGFKLVPKADRMDFMADSGRLESAIYSHASEERIRVILESVGYSRDLSNMGAGLIGPGRERIHSVYGTLDRHEIYDKENPASYGYLRNMMLKDNLIPKAYVTHKVKEARAANQTLDVVLLELTRPE